jgi:hypothetical protein
VEQLHMTGSLFAGEFHGALPSVISSDFEAEADA